MRSFRGSACTLRTDVQTLRPSRGSGADGTTPRSSAQRLCATGTAAICAVLAWPAVMVICTTNAPYWGPQVRAQAILLIILPAVQLARTVATRRFNLPLSIFWAWNIVFMGLAPAYQMNLDSFPWGGEFTRDSIASAQQVLLLGDLCVMAGAYWIAKRRSRRDRTDRIPDEAVPQHASLRAAALLNFLGFCYSVVGAAFILLMGSSLFQARAVFREQVLRIADLPFGGTLYFLVTAGAIGVPAAVIAGRRSGLPVSRLSMTLSLTTAAIVTNPFLGSRFLTGSFLVAVTAAAVGRRSAVRVLPVASVLLLVVLFPTLDVLRGDGTGSQRVALVSPAESLVTYSFDAFEMLIREVSLTEAQRQQLPTSTELALAPALRWVPLLSRPYIGLSGGAVVAEATGMQYTNVSMPLWGEGDLVAGTAGVVVVMGALGAWLGIAGGVGRIDTIPSRVVAPANAALLFIVLRGSLYEVLAYLVLVVAVYAGVKWALASRDRRRRRRWTRQRRQRAVRRADATAAV